MKKVIIISVLVIIAVVAWYGYSEFNRKNKDLQSVKADVTIDAASLITAYEKDSATANKQYTDKIVAVNGAVKNIDADGNPVVITLGDAGQMSSVQCSMDSSHAADYKVFKQGDHLTIKGKCTGGRTEDMFGTDVILNRCVVENKK
jgi:hypothetical protein